MYGCLIRRRLFIREVSANFSYRTLRTGESGGKKNAEWKRKGEKLEWREEKKRGDPPSRALHIFLSLLLTYIC